MRKAFQLAVGAAAALVSLEVILRLLPVNHGWANPPVTADAPVIRQRPNAAYVYSHGWDMRNAVSGRFNALGFPSQLRAARDRPEVVLIGDSFIEASMLPVGRKIEDRLDTMQDRYVVNAFAMSGSDIPAYAIYSRWAAQTRRPAVIAINIVGGDLKGAVAPNLRGWWWTLREGGLVDHAALNFGLRNALAESRLLSYILFNLRFNKDSIAGDFKPKPPPAPEGFMDDSRVGKAAGPTPPRPPSAAGRAAADRFIREMAALQRSGPHVILMFDGDRPAIYAGRPPAREDADVLLQRAHAAGLDTLDLNTAFVADWRANHRRFDFGALDNHWNAYGAQVVAQALAAKLTASPAFDGRSRIAP